jgi:hypothetical protein
MVSPSPHLVSHGPPATGRARVWLPMRKGAMGVQSFCYHVGMAWSWLCICQFMGISRGKAGSPQAAYAWHRVD